MPVAEPTGPSSRPGVVGGTDRQFGPTTAPLPPKKPTRRRRRRERREPVGGADRQFGPTSSSAPIRDVLTPARGERELGPVPVAISNLGIPNMREFNRRLTAVVRAHRAVHGVDPTPGFAWDLLSEDRDEKGYMRLLRAGVSPIRNRVPAPLSNRDFGPRSGGEPRTSPFIEEVEVPEFLQHAFGPTLAPSIRALKPDAALARSQFNTALRASVYDGLTESSLAWEQIKAGITGIPGGIAYLATAVGLDIRDVGTHAYDFTVGRIPGAPDVRVREIKGRTLDVGEEMAKGLWEILSNPVDHPGDYLLLLPGIVNPAASIVSRTSLATRALVAGKGAGAVSKALVFRPNPGTFTLGIGEYQAIVPLSHNIIWRELVQRQRLEAKQQKLSRRWGPDGTGAPPYGALRRTVGWFFSPERTLERNYLKQRSMALQLRLAPLDDLDHHIRWNASKESIVNDLLLDHRFARWMKQLSNRTGLEKAIEILATASDDPLTAHRGFHERMIQQGVGLEDAHRAQLTAIDAATEFLENPDKRIARGPSAPTFRELYESVRRTAEAREELLSVYFGADTPKLNKRLASHAAVLRGEFESTRTKGLVPGSRERGRLDQVRSQIDRIEMSLNRALENRESEYLRRLEVATTQLERARGRRELETFDDPDPARLRRPMDEEDARAHLELLERELDPFLEVLWQDAGNALGRGSVTTPDGHVIRSMPQIEASFRNARSGKKKARADQRGVDERQAELTSRKIREIRDGTWQDPQLRWLQSIIREADDLRELLWVRDRNRQDVESGLFGPEDLLEEHPFPEAPDVPALGLAPRAARPEKGHRALAGRTAAELAESLAKREISQLEQGKGLSTQARVDSLNRRLGRLYGEEDGLLDLLGQADTLADVAIDPLTRASYAKGFTPFYVPSQRVPNFRRQFGGLRRTVAGYGLKAVETFDELEREFTGNSIRIGDTRFDTSTLTVRSYAKAAKAVERVAQSRGLWDMGIVFKTVADARANGMVPIRSSREVPDRLKAMLADVDDGTLKGSTWENVTDERMQELERWLNPPIDEVLPEELPNVRWVDPRFVVWRPNEWKQLDKVLSGVAYVPNEVFRLTNLFLRPAYALNALGAFALNMIQQGPLAPVNLGRALLARHKWGEDAQRQLMKLGGETRTASFMTERGYSPSALLYRFWEPITDRHFRVGAVIYELRKLGIKDGEMRRHLGLEGELTPDERLKVTEAGLRARRAMIDFELMPFESATMRHIFFVYAYMSRSAVWAVHAMIDHPTATAAMVLMGQENDEALDEALGAAKPGWVDKMGGLFYAGHDEQGRPLVENWSQLSNYTTLAELANVGAGLFTDVKYQSIEELYSGWPTLLNRLASGKDEHGRDFDRGNFEAAILAMMGETVAGSVWRSVFDQPSTTDGTEEEISPFAMSMREAISSSGTNPLLSRENAGAERPVMSDEGFMRIVGPIVFGGSRSRAWDMEAAAARYWRDQPRDVRRQHEMATIMQYLGIQARTLGTKAPDELKAAIRTVFRVNNAKDGLREANPVWENGVPARSEIRVWLAAGKAEGIITSEQEAQIKRLAKRAAGSPEEIKAVLKQVQQLVAGPISEWDEDLKRLSLAANPLRMSAAVDVLAGLGQTVDRSAKTAPKEALLEYARRVLAYQKEEDRHDNSDISDAEFREYQARNDKPIKIRGITFPSPQRLEWASKADEDRARDLANWSNGDWHEISSFEKELLGRTVSPTVQAGWTVLQRAYDDYKAQHGPYSRVSKEMMRNLARDLDRDPRYRGVYADILFAQQTPLRRFESLNVYRRSDHKRRWDEILGPARDAERALNSGDFTKTYVREQWAVYIEENVLPWARQQGGGFAQEIDDMGETFLKGMIG